MIKLILKIKHEILEIRYRRYCRQADRLMYRYGVPYYVFRVGKRFVVLSKQDVRRGKNLGYLKRGFTMDMAIYKSKK